MVVSFSPLEQFEVSALLAFSSQTPCGEPSVFLVLTNANLFAFLVFVALLCLSRYLSLNPFMVPSSSFQSFCENFVIFAASLVRENTAGKHRILMVYTPYVLAVFGFILMSNFVGMVPYSFTVTGSLAATFALASSSFIGINIFGTLVHRLGFLGIFLPPGCPVYIAPFIILIETVSYVARVFSLSIRLFANMMAGHTLLKILSGFAWQMLSVGGIWLLASLGPVGVISAVCVLELAVAFLQTYVFTVLICLYIKDAAELH